ncbi:hypothetical protein MMU07_17180 [Aquiflexum sp. LQ15W]|uniref:hypothetical protein n=1 Tax=Cognataquiflexum nitidum TaxID=2922272 RepID=UPI001F13AEF8|nr:hypothetical protein [Cognataquiflexum nitidum]MCH6201319.1 hypothetical protein [Cognataquiflexum nitidum]
MDNTVTEFVQIFSLIIATVVAGISLFTFRRNKNIELQNHLFQLKTVAFSNLISEFVKLLSIYNRMINRYHKILDQDLNLDEKALQLDNLSYKVDTQIIEIHKAIGKNSVYFSANITTLLTEFTNKFYGNFEGLEDQDMEKVQDAFEIYTKKQSKDMSSIIEKMRDELGLEKLNEELFKRVKNGKLNPIASSHEK